jgi:hypothetical protein
MTSQRHPHFTVFLTPDGYPESDWRVQEHDPVESASVDSFFRSAALAERGLLDAVFIADQPALTAFRASFFPQVRYDPITLLTALGMPSRRRQRIGAARWRRAPTQSCDGATSRTTPASTTSASTRDDHRPPRRPRVHRHPRAAR